MGIGLTLFLAGFVALLALAFLAHPAFGLFAYLLTFYCHPPTMWPGALPDVRWSLMAAAVALFASLLHGSNRPALGTRSAKIIALYAGWMWLQIGWAVSLAGALEGAILLSKYVVLLALICRTIDSRRRITQFAWAHVLGCCIFAAIAWSDPSQFISPSGRIEKLGGPGVDDSNTLAAHLVTALALAGALLFSSPVALRVVALGATGLIMNTVILCNSRGALTGMGAAVLAGGVLAPVGRRKGILLVGALAAILLVALAQQAFWDRMSSIVTYDADASAASRLELVRPSLQVFLDHPLGAGHDGFRVLSPRYCPVTILGPDGTRSPHATVLAVLADQGIVGIVLFLLLGVAVARELWQLRCDALALPEATGRPYLLAAIGIGAGLAAFAVAGLTSNYLKAEVQIWLIGLVAAARYTLADEIDASEGSRPERAGVDAEAPSGRHRDLVCAH